jgi:polar amino acid transport system permease protein
MDFDLSPIYESWEFLAAGLMTTLMLSLLCAVASLVAGLTLAVGRVYGGGTLKALIGFYVDTMRAIPVLVVIVWIYFALPLVTGVNLPPFWSAFLAITIHVAAYVTEIVRAGIESIRQGQVRAALALGMTYYQVLKIVVLPQALIRVLPAIGSIVSVTIKDTAIASVIAVPEYMKQSETVAAQSFHPIEVFSLAMIVYFAILFPATRMIDSLYRRYAYLGQS